jgi:multidrug resistance efflux pump
MKTLYRSPWFYRLLGLTLLPTSLACVTLHYSLAGSPPPASETAVADVTDRTVSGFGHVDVEQGIASLYPLQPGRVSRLLVREGDTVRTGAPLVELDDRLARDRALEAEAALELARTQLTQARRLPEQHRLKTAQQEEAIEAVHLRLSAARHLLAIKEQLLKNNLLNSHEAEAARAQAGELEVLGRVEQVKLCELGTQDPALAVARAEKEVAMAHARLSQARQVLDECIVRAPQAGIVLRVLAAPGEVLTAQARQPVVLFCPDAPRVVRAEVDQEFAARLAAGQPAVVEDDVRSGNAWRGRVLRVSDWYLRRRSVLLEPPQFQDVRTVECLISLEEGWEPLRIGQRVRVRVSERTAG